MTKKLPPPPKISIVVPVFNAEEFISTCIESILQQKFRDFEVIIVDDCSTDRSVEIIESFDDPRIRLVKQIKNSGESASRNLGLTLARGKYVYFMDNDDAIMPQTLEIFYKAAEESQADVVIMNSYFETNDSNFSLHGKVKLSRKPFYHPEPRTLSENLEERLRYEIIRIGMFVMPWLKFQRRDFLIQNQILFPTTELGGDILQNLAQLCLGKRIDVIDACGYVYRQHPNQTMKLAPEKHIRKALTSIPIAMKYIREVFAKTELPRQFQIMLENHIISVNYFIPLMLPAYEGAISRDKIDEILNEVCHLDEMNVPDLLRVFVNLSANLTIDKNRLLKQITTENQKSQRRS